ncbi:hypothetical protein GCM10028820_22440 [Tessaracoccus terricola]
MPEAAYVIYDLSTPVLGLDPTYTSLQASAFTVVSACGLDTDHGGDVVPLGVIPTAELSDDVRSRAASGEFDSLLAECSSYRS